MTTLTPPAPCAAKSFVAKSGTGGRTTGLGHRETLFMPQIGGQHRRTGKRYRRKKPPEKRISEVAGRCLGRAFRRRTTATAELEDHGLDSVDGELAGDHRRHRPVGRVWPARRCPRPQSASPRGGECQ